MKLESFGVAWAGLSLLPRVIAYPGMDAVLEHLEQLGSQDTSTELIGDLVSLQPKDYSTVGRLVAGILTGDIGGESDEYNYNVPVLGTNACEYDKCCVWQHIVYMMEKYFRNYDGQCTNAARAAIRLGFHDAAGWSKSTGNFGGADGSVVLSNEGDRQENQGLKEIITQMKIWFNQWNSFGISMADLIQVAANTATVVCPLGPRIRTFVGRSDSAVPAPEGLLPSPFDVADSLIELFRDKTIQPRGLIALLGAHSTSRQRFVDPTRLGAPQDSTPGVWDVLFYNQTLGPVPGDIFVFPSDLSLAQYPSTHEIFRAYAHSQAQWNTDYAREYVRLSLLGVFNINNLTDCTRVLPPAIRY
ncbi:putative lip/Mn/Versatile peroxidase [Naviculisporaceae sp. PSN 640]